jgi:hypothetical protein
MNINTEMTTARPADNHDISMVLDRVKNTRKEDWACPRNQVRLNWNADARQYRVTLGGQHEFNTNEHFQSQVASKSVNTKGVPGMVAYSRYLNETNQQELLVDNVNRQLDRSEETAFIRTVGNEEPTARAFLSNKYKAIDDDDVFLPAVEIIGDHADKFRTLGGQRTDVKTCLKFITRDKICSVGNRDLFAGFQLTNSEVGMGSAKYSAFLFDEFCENGCVFGSIDLFQVNFVHRGAKLNTKFGQVFGDEFRAAEIASIRAAIAEATLRALDDSYHAKIADIIETGEKRKITGHVPTVIEEVGKRVGLTEQERIDTLAHWNSSEDNAFGLQAAITEVAQESSSFNRRSELEKAGGVVLEFSDSLWNAVSALKAPTKKKK